MSDAVEQIARRLCARDHGEYASDRLVSVQAAPVYKTPVGDAACIDEMVTVPLWQTYASQANVIVDEWEFLVGVMK